MISLILYPEFSLPEQEWDSGDSPGSRLQVDVETLYRDDIAPDKAGPNVVLVQFCFELL